MLQQNPIGSEFLENLIRILVVAAFFLGPLIKGILERNKSEQQRRPRPRPKAPQRPAPKPAPPSGDDPWERLLRGEDPRDVASVETVAEPEPEVVLVPESPPEPAPLSELEQRLADTHAAAELAERELAAELTTLGEGFGVDLPGDDLGTPGRSLPRRALPSRDQVPGLGAAPAAARAPGHPAWPELRRAGSLRRAFVLSEVLGAPVGTRATIGHDPR